MGTDPYLPILSSVLRRPRSGTVHPASLRDSPHFAGFILNQAVSVPVPVSFPKPIRNRQSSVPSKSLRGDLHAWRGLAAFVFVAVDYADDAADGFLVKAHRRDDLLGIALDIAYRQVELCLR